MSTQPDGLRSVAPELTPREVAATRAAAAWVQQLARTLKTCRLYDRDNPTVVRFREDLATALASLLGEHGDLTLTFAPTDVLCREVSLYPARSREDNLALPFYRDGVRGLTFRAGIEPREVETFLDAVLHVTTLQGGEDDLVILLWDAGLPHLDVAYVSTSGDVEGGGDSEDIGVEAHSVSPWPAREAGGGLALPAPQARPGGDGGDDQPLVRSDDRLTGDLAGDLEGTYADLDQRSSDEVERLLADHAADVSGTLVHVGLDLMRDCLEVSDQPADLDELAPFLQRILREAIGGGLWAEAQETLGLLERCGAGRWSLETFVTELCEANSLTTRNAVAEVDRQEARGVEAFLDLARALGPAAVEWLMRILAASQQQRARRPLARVLAELCRDRPECLAPWLSDARWYVVRNVVHILGWVGGPAIVGLLRPASRHEEYRVRREVVAALAQAGPQAARPLLVEMLEGADTRIFCAVLHQLSSGRDPELARRLIAQLQDAGFGERPAEEQRAVLSTIAAVADDDAVPALEAELNKGGWFAKTSDQHRQAVARCLARLATPAAVQALAAGRRSRNASVRKACEDATGGGETA
jgi:HEAT repeat protein